METYLQTHSDITLTHELCSECETKLSPVLADRGQDYSSELST